MRASIDVRVMLDSYDLAHPREKQTQVFVRIPGLDAAMWLLPSGHYDFSRTEPWPSVVDSAQEHYQQSRAVTDSKSEAARQAVMEWLADDGNHDAMQAAWEADVARRHPVARKLLKENEQLRARVADLEAERAADHKTWQHDLRTARGECEATAARVAGLEKRLHDAAMARVWRNEDGKKFVFVEDIAPALLGIEPKPDSITRRINPLQALREDGQPEQVSRSVTKLRALLAGQREAVDGEHYASVHHDYRTPHDLPELGGRS